MKTLKLSILAAFVLTQAAFAGLITYDSPLLGTSEVPPTGSTATGFASVTIDTIAQTMDVQITFTGLAGVTTASHIHCCLTIPGVGNAGVATTTPSFAGFPLGVTSGSYDSGALDLTNASTYNPAFVTAEGSLSNAEAALLAGLAAGDTYLNIHSSVDPGGEIRGFLVAVPEPTTFALLGAGLLGLVLRRHKRAA